MSSPNRSVSGPAPGSSPEHPTFTIDVNGERRHVPAASSIATLLGSLGLEGRRVAVAVNRAVIPRSAYPTHTLAPDDRVEILEAVGGG